MDELPKITDPARAARLWQEVVAGGCSEVALVRNPACVSSPIELYALAEKNPGPLSQVVAFVKDMDGTTTTTEPLCLHSLEWMVRRITNRLSTEQWPGLDSRRDYPHVIGNSTTRHVEYLLNTYTDRIVPQAFRRALIEAVFWTLSRDRDPQRRRDIIADAVALGLADLLDDSQLVSAVEKSADPFGAGAALVDQWLERHGRAIRLATFAEQVRAAVAIYYLRYHSILEDLAAGRSAECARQALAGTGDRLVEPMPAVGVFLATIKGWLGEHLRAFCDALADHVAAKTKAELEDGSRLRETLAAVGRCFRDRPARVAVVTSSVRYEAEIVLAEVFRILREEVTRWPIPQWLRDRIVEGFADYRRLYDGFVSASDSSEIRLKPHRDLYSLALHQMGVAPEQYDRVVGFEDSESGVTAIRAAGVGLCVAVPFAATAGHDFSAATYVLHGQLPEAILVHRCFLSPEALGEYA